MGKLKSEEPKEGETKKTNASPADILIGHIKENKDEHLNLAKKTANYTISSGSLILDLEIGGGLKPAVYSATGISGGGKSSSTLSFMSEFLKQPKRMAIYFEVERPLSQEHKDRTDIKFIESENFKDWADQTCYLYKGNIFEDVVSQIQDLINNDLGYKYFFVIDSMNALIPKEDTSKSIYEAIKVGGGALLTSHSMRLLSLKHCVLGHYCFCINQVRSKIQINPYKKNVENLAKTSSRPSSLDHYSEIIFEFHETNKSDYIYKDAAKTEKLGKWAKVVLQKNNLENKGELIEYPLRFGVTGKNIVWKEREIMDMLITWEHIKKDGAWMYPSSELVACLLSGNFKIEEKFQEKGFMTYLDEDSLITDFLFEKCKNLVKCGRLDSCE
jgi:RecA/RadA recombinase